MGFEFVYAYLENLNIAVQIIFVLVTILLGILLLSRFDNDIDVDDWMSYMKWVVPAWLIFGAMMLSPGMEHVRQVKTALNEVIKPVVEKTTEKETNNEIINLIPTLGSKPIGVLCSGPCR